VHIRFDAPGALTDRMDKLARDRGQTRSHFLRQLIREELQRYQPDSPFIEAVARLRSEAERQNQITRLLLEAHLFFQKRFLLTVPISSSLQDEQSNDKASKYFVEYWNALAKSIAEGGWFLQLLEDAEHREDGDRESKKDVGHDGFQRTGPGTA
jgi:predicted transcriptional regulator